MEKQTEQSRCEACGAPITDRAASPAVRPLCGECARMQVVEEPHPHDLHRWEDDGGLPPC